MHSGVLCSKEKTQGNIFEDFIIWVISLNSAHENNVYHYVYNRCENALEIKILYTCEHELGYLLYFYMNHYHTENYLGKFPDFIKHF